MQKIDNLFKNVNVKKIFGTAGAGKTTYLIKENEELFKQGVSPEEIVFVSFTKTAVEEMINRMIIKFPQFTKEQFNNFKTLHALCYRYSKNKNVMDYKDLLKVTKPLGLEISMFINPEDGGGNKVGDKVITIESLSRLRMVDLKQQWEDCNFDNCPYHIVQEFSEHLNKYKEENNKIDYTDMLESYSSGAIGNVKYFFVDEAQDLSPLQWKVVDQMASNCEKVIIAGDDDQAIYNWAGADVNYILNIKNDEEVILNKSYRLPKKIYDLSRVVLKRIGNRKQKESDPIEKEGSINHYNSFSNIEFKPNEDYLILVRNNYLMKNIKETLEDEGIGYVVNEVSSLKNDETRAIVDWEKFRNGKVITYNDFENIKKYSIFLAKYKKENVPEELKKEWFSILNNISKAKYYRLCLTNGYKFNEMPKVTISSIHKAKGGECQNVVIITDVSFITWSNIYSDDEHRVWYVAVSRCKENLHIVMEQGNKFYKI